MRSPQDSGGSLGPFWVVTASKARQKKIIISDGIGIF
jgi:hypothetical protein